MSRECRCEKKVLKTIKVLLRRPVYYNEVNLQMLKDVENFLFDRSCLDTGYGLPISMNA